MRWFISLVLFALPFVAQATPPQLAVTDNGTVKEEVFQLVKSLGFKGPNKLDDINAFAQNNFLRPAGVERWDIQDDQEILSHRNQIVATLEQLGFFREASPPLAQPYENILILGASVERMRSRVSFFNQLANRGLKYQRLYFLTGERPLDPKIEDEQVLYMPTAGEKFRSGWQKPTTATPKTESTAARLVWDQIIGPNGQAPVFVATPMRGTKRPNTADTIKSWLALSPKKGRTLVISNNPYVPYQHAMTVSELLANDFFGHEETGLVVTGGSAANRDTQKARVLLDNLARTIFGEKQIRDLYAKKADEQITLSNDDLKSLYDKHQRLLANKDVTNRPFVVVFSGTQGMGKTHLARALEKDLQGVRFSTNVLRAMMMQNGMAITRGNTGAYTDYFLAKHLENEKNKLVILDTSVDRYWAELRPKLVEKKIPYFFVRLEIPRPVVMRRLMERNDFGMLREHMGQYFNSHQALAANYWDDFDVVLNESVLLSNEELADLTAAVGRKMAAARSNS